MHTLYILYIQQNMNSDSHTVIITHVAWPDHAWGQLQPIYNNFHDYQSYTSSQTSHWLEMLGLTCSPYCMPGATGSSRYREKRHKQWLSRKENKGGTFHEFAYHPCVRGHANLLCIIPGLVCVTPNWTQNKVHVYAPSCTTCTLSCCSPLHELCQEVIL